MIKFWRPQLIATERDTFKDFSQDGPKASALYPALPGESTRDY